MRTYVKVFTSWCVCWSVTMGKLLLVPRKPVHFYWKNLDFKRRTFVTTFLQKLVMVLFKKISQFAYNKFKGQAKKALKIDSPVKYLQEPSHRMLFSMKWKTHWSKIVQNKNKGAWRLFCLCTSSYRRCSINKVFLKILENSQENTCIWVSFLIKLQTLGLQLY